MISAVRRLKVPAWWPALGVMLLTSCDATPVPERPVGLAFANYADMQRPSFSSAAARPLATTVWYPVAAGTAATRWQVAFFDGGPSAIEAPLAPAPAKFPLVVLSHGTGGSSITLSWLARTLASNGYIVASVNHHGNTGAEPEYLPQGFALWWERARDVSVLLDKLAADGRFGPRIDMGRVGIAGFSLGGYTALAAVGARLDRVQWERFCAQSPSDPNCVVPDEAPFTSEQLARTLQTDEKARQSVQRAGASYRDGRFRAAFVMAPVLGPALTPDSLAQIRVPVSLLVGEKDKQAPPAINAQRVAGQIAGATLERVSGGTHYMFIAPCNTRGKLVAYSICTDPLGLDRRDVQRDAADKALRFFDAALGKPGT